MLAKLVKKTGQKKCSNTGLDEPARVRLTSETRQLSPNQGDQKKWSNAGLGELVRVLEVVGLHEDRCDLSTKNSSNSKIVVK